MIVYEAVNKTNGKVYVGLTATSLEKRKGSHLRSAKAGSGSYFHKALRKYGEDAFEWSVVMTCSTKEAMYKAEMFCISLYEQWQIYNTSLGGEHSAYGMRHTEETKAVCRQHGLRRWDGKRSSDTWADEVFSCSSYKEAKSLYGIPKTTWYRGRSSRSSTFRVDKHSNLD